MANIVFIGDIALNGEYINLKEKNVAPFRSILQAFSNSDFIVGNLEAFCSGTKGVNLLKVPRLNTTEQTLLLLKELNINLLTLANNHVYDNLEDGFLRTIDGISKLGISFMGANLKNTNNTDSVIYTVCGIKVAFLNYVHLGTNPNIPINSQIHVNIYDRDRIIDEIKVLKAANDIIILIPHWGIDNSYFPAPWQRSDAKAFIKAGANLVIGHHSHTIQGYEKIDDGYVFYSLGNFCFSSFMVDETEYGVDVRRNTESFILKIYVEKGGVERFELVPIVNKDLMVMFGHEKIIKKIERRSFYLPYLSIFWPFYIVYLNFFYKLFFFFFGNGRDPINRLKMIDRKRIKRLAQLLKGN